MPDLLKANCPVCGLLLSTMTIPTQHKDDMVAVAKRAHATWDLNTTVTCANGHSFAVQGTVEVRWAPRG